MENENKVNLKKTAVLYGLILGIISIILGVMYMYFAKEITSSTSFYAATLFVNIVFPVAIAVFFILKLRRKNGGYWGYRTALEQIFIMLAVSVVLSTVGSNLFNAAYPGLQEELMDNTRNLTIESLDSLGVEDSAIDEAVASIDEQREQIGNISAGQMIKGIFISLILYFVFALILAAIFKKEQPVFYHQEEENSSSSNEDVL